MLAPIPKKMFPLAKTLFLSFTILGAGCTEKITPSTLSTGPETSVTEGHGIKPHYGFCHPDRVQTFEVVPYENQTSYGFTENQPRVKVKLDLNEEGLVRCNIEDCSITYLKPIAVEKSIPLGLGVSVTVQLVIQGQKQLAKPAEKKIFAGISFTPVNIGIASISVGLAGDYTQWREENQQEIRESQIRLRRKLGLNPHVKLGLPTLELEVGLNDRGIYYHAVGDTASGTKFSFGKVSTQYLRASAAIDYRHIPRATLVGTENLLRYLTGSVVAGAKALTSVSALAPLSAPWKQVVQSCRHLFSHPCLGEKAPKKPDVTRTLPSPDTP